MFYCYLLYTDGGHTYVGATTDPDRRLQQHNGERSGGARATGIRVHQGYEWKRACYLKGIPEWRSALQMEWRWKQLGRTQCKSVRNPIDRRLTSLHYLLTLDKPTSASVPYDCYPDGPPQIVWDSEELRMKYDQLNTTTASCNE